MLVSCDEQIYDLYTKPASIGSIYSMQSSPVAAKRNGRVPSARARKRLCRHHLTTPRCKGIFWGR